jgi:hypothetical protein
MLLKTAAAAAWLLATARAQSLSLATSYSGSTFFDGFNYNASVIDYFSKWLSH